MTQNNKQPPTPTPENTGNVDASPAQDTKPTHGIGRDLWRGFLFTLLILGAKIAIEHTSVGKQIESAGYVFLQQQLHADTLSVQVVDISDLEITDTTINGKTYSATPRDALTDIIQAIADQDPAAIGVDIDFSPDGGGYITPKDPEFFQFCLDMDVPVFLGIHRTQALPPEKWLGDSRYARLAANIIIPRDAARMPVSIQTSPGFKPGPSLGAALTAAFEKARCAVGEFLTGLGLAEQTHTRELGAGGQVDEFLVDYGSLEGLMNNRLPTKNPAVIRDQGRLLKNKIVLVGDGTPGEADDTFTIPGRPEPVPGVYVHASAVQTLYKTPLYHLNWRGRVVIDVLLVAIVLLFIVLVKLAVGKENRARVATERLQLLAIIVVVIVAFGVGVIFVYKTCVLWTDFILALGAVALHPAVERRVESLWKFGKRVGPKAAGTVVFKDEPDAKK